MTQTHRITFEPVDIELEVGEDESILDAAFRQNVHLMHGCREGQCSACKSYVLDGDIQMARYSTFACNDAEVDEGYVLLCRSHAFSDCTIELLNFDEEEMRNAIPIQDMTTTVAAIEPLTRDIVGLSLDVGDTGFAFKPGQYADLTIPGSTDHRSFSMATTPTGSGPGGQVCFIIKKYPGGRFSGLLDDGLTAGSELQLRGPYGACTLKDGHVLPIVAVAGGAGMAPILALLRHLAETESSRPVHFYYGARTTQDLFFLDVIREVGSCLVDFRFVVGLSEELPAGWKHEGVVAEEGLITDVVGRHEGNLRGTEVYLCGPPPMVDATTALLEQHGVPADQIFFDKFTSPMTA